jgi:arginine:pyruvate transaminase
MRYAALTNRVAGKGSDVWKVHMEANHMAAAGHEILILSIANPDQAPSPALLDATIAALRDRHTGYAAIIGERELREPIAARYAARTGQPCTFENVVVVQGAQAGLFFSLLCIAGVGDEVLVPEPMYATYEAACGASGATLVHTPLRPEGGFHPDLAALERAITPRTRVIWINTPHNPTGAVLRRDELEFIGALCRKHDLWLLSDEVYEEFAYARPHTSAWSLPDMQDRTIVVSSLSKSHAVPGFRLGWVVGPKELLPHLWNILNCGTFGGSPFVHEGAQVVFEKELPEGLEMRAIYQRRAAMMTRELRDTRHCQVSQPEGGMFVLLDVRDTGLGAEDFARALLHAEHVSVLPCDGFGPSAVGHVRISLTAPDEKLEEGARRIVKFTTRLAAEKHPSR